MIRRRSLMIVVSPPTNHRVFNLQGYSLVELVIVIVILAIISAVLSFLLMRGFSNYFESQQLTENQSNSLLAMTYLSNDLRRIRDPLSVIVADTHQISFVDVDGTTLTYSLSANQLIRDEGTPQVLTKNVQTFDLQYYDATGATTTTIENICYINLNFTIKEYDDLSRFNTTIYPRFIQ